MNRMVTAYLDYAENMAARNNVWSLYHQSDLIHHSRYFLSEFS